jgi:uncharacterized protein (DUF2062 family)
MPISGQNRPLPSNGPRIICVVYAVREVRRLPDLIRRIRSFDHPVMVIDAATDGHLERSLASMEVPIIADHRPHGKGHGILAAAEKAHRLGKTHMVTLDAETGDDPRDIGPFVTAIRENHDALVIGRRAESKKRRRFDGTNFWLRLQTGTVLKDAACTFRAYPLGALRDLKIWSRGALFDMEVLVRAAWAGVPFQEVPVSSSAAPDLRRRRTASPWTALGRTLLNIHLTMRSITPLPHPKIRSPEAGQRDKKISVLHPLRSIRALLTENITPKRLAAAAALGIFLGTLPLIALHVVTILFAAGYFRLNKVAALTASQLCMPPIVPALCIETGYFIRHGEFLTEISFETIGYQALERLWEWLLGSLVLAPLLALGVGAIVYFLALLVQKGLLQRNGN